MGASRDTHPISSTVQISGPQILDAIYLPKPRKWIIVGRTGEDSEFLHLLTRVFLGDLDGCCPCFMVCAGPSRLDMFRLL